PMPVVHRAGGQRAPFAIPKAVIVEPLQDRRPPDERPLALRERRPQRRQDGRPAPITLGGVPSVSPLLPHGVGQACGTVASPPKRPASAARFSSSSSSGSSSSSSGGVGTRLKGAQCSS